MMRAQWGRLSTCGRLSIGLAVCKKIRRPVNNRPQVDNLPHMATS
jgi:hypothetical protein